MEVQLLTLLQQVRDDGDEAARTELNQLLRKHPEARTIMAKLLIDEQALISHLRDESIVSILDRERDTTTSLRPSRHARRPLIWRPLIAGLVAGVLAGLMGAGMVWAMNSTEAMARVFNIADGDFESSELGPIPNRFPVRFGEWCGDPAEIIERAGGNRELRFLETANVTGLPNGPASACDVFQLIDLKSLREQWRDMAPEGELTLNLSASFRRDNSQLDLPRARAVCRITLFQTTPETIGKEWPHIVREAVAVGGKAIRLGPAEESPRISASCILPPEATVALITVSVNSGINKNTPTRLGGYFVDNVRLTAIKQPTLRVRFVQ